MGRIRGFMLKHRVTTIFRRFFRRRCSTAAYHRLGGRSDRVEPFSRLLSWTDLLKAKAKAVLCRNVDPGRGYVQVGQDSYSKSIPKGHMAVYVGQKDGDFQRILVPIVYINHPLFGNLLKESEKEFGFNHPGGLTIPCGISDFESVQTRIKAVRSTRKLLSWRKTIGSY